MDIVKRIDELYADYKRWMNGPYGKLLAARDKLALALVNAWPALKARLDKAEEVVAKLPVTKDGIRIEGWDGWLWVRHRDGRIEEVWTKNCNIGEFGRINVPVKRADGSHYFEFNVYSAREAAAARNEGATGSEPASATEVPPSGTP